MTAETPDEDAVHEDAVRADIVRVGRHLSSLGLSPGSSGNVSVRLGNAVFITPTGSSLARVQPADIAVAALDRASSDGAVHPGPKPSKELPLHLAVYLNRPDARAVIHLHSPYATAVACLAADPDGVAALPVLTPYRWMRLGTVPLIGYAAPGSIDLRDGVARHAAAHGTVLLANHGSVVAAPTLDGATDLAEELEAAAQLAVLLRGFSPIPLTAEQRAELDHR